MRRTVSRVPIGLALTLTLALAWPARPAAAAGWAQAPAGSADPASWAGRTVLEVVVTIADAPTSEARWLSLIETPPGSQLSLSDLRTTLLHFFHTGMFEAADAAIDPVGTAGGIRVTYRLTPQHAVAAITFRGDSSGSTPASCGAPPWSAPGRRCRPRAPMPRPPRSSRCSRRGVSCAPR